MRPVVVSHTLTLGALMRRYFVFVPGSIQVPVKAATANGGANGR